jgi:penicillin-binding protein 1A
LSPRKLSPSKPPPTRPPFRASSRPTPQGEPKRPPSRPPVPTGRRIRNWLLKWIAVTAIWGGIAGFALLSWYAYGLPDVTQVAQAERRPAITVTAADGSTIARFGDLYGATVNAADLPPHLIEAVLATEDRRFYSHFGIDPIGLARAFFTNWRAGRVVQGGSTITQQLAKNLFLSPDRTLKRNLQEAMPAVWLERTYTKNQILTAYLNRVYFGAGTYGVDAASQVYFNKPVTEINLREAAILAGLLKAPSRYSPSANPDKAAERAEVVLGAMVAAGFITQDDIRAAHAQPPTPRRKPYGDSDRYFAAWVADQVNDFIGEDHSDVIVHTTLDRRLQRAAEWRIDAMLAGPAVAAKAGQAALVALTPEGAVRALVGGGDYADSPFNRATKALRQPGSAFKPFVFLAALEAGMTADTAVEDGPIRIGTWQPANFEKGFNGSVTLRDALAHSINTAAVRVLDRTGIDRVHATARRLGITAPLGHDLSLALGTSEVTLLELTGAYTAFANGGRAVWPYAITEIRDRGGQVLYQRRSSGGNRVIDPANLTQIDRMMISVVEYGTGKAARLDRMAAGKTGTSQDYRDGWFLGFTADYVAGVWLGNDDNAPMKRVTGGGLPAKLWHDFMVDAHEGLPARDLPGLYGPSPSSRTPLVAEGDPPAGPTGSISDVPVLGAFQRLIQQLTGSARVEYTYPDND